MPHMSSGSSERRFEEIENAAFLSANPLVISSSRDWLRPRYALEDECETSIQIQVPTELQFFLYAQRRPTARWRAPIQLRHLSESSPCQRDRISRKGGGAG